MSRFFSRPAAAIATMAAFAMTASPVMARDWYGGGGHWRRHHDGIDTGDVLAGVLVIGGIAIAAAASSASKAKRDSDYRYPDGGSPDRRDDDYHSDDYRDDGGRYGDRRDDGPAPGARSGEALSGAVDRCVDAVERADRRVDTVDNVSRTMDGYRVEGRVGSGQGFTCTVDGGGQIRSVAVDGRAI